MTLHSPKLRGCLGSLNYRGLILLKDYLSENRPRLPAEVQVRQLFPRVLEI